MNKRENTANKSGLANIKISETTSVTGLVLLSDEFVLPEGSHFTGGHESGYDTNVNTKDEWEIMEAFGAVFLPAAGYRYNSNVNGSLVYGYYWTPSVSDSSKRFLFFYSSNMYMGYGDASSGRAIRLVSVQEEGPEVKISFDAKGGTGTMDAVSARFGDEIRLPANVFTIDNLDYVFVVWTTDSNSRKIVYNDEGIASVTEDTTFYAVWKDIHEFSLSAEKSVLFSKGNLYYSGAEKKLAIEENQYDFRTWNGKNACINGIYSETGTSNNDVGLFLLSSSLDVAKAAVYNDSGASTEDVFSAKNVTIDGEEWKVMTCDEWSYLLYDRNEARSKL